MVIVKLFKEFKKMLYEQKLIVWTDHKNLTYLTTKFSYSRVLHQDSFKGNTGNIGPPYFL